MGSEGLVRERDRVDMISSRLCSGPVADPGKQECCEPGHSNLHLTHCLSRQRNLSAIKNKVQCTRH